MAEHNLGYTDHSKVVAAKSQSFRIDHSNKDAVDIIRRRYTALANHETSDLEWSLRRVAISEDGYGKDSTEYVNAKSCLVCKAISVSSPKAEQYITECEEALAGFSNYLKKAEIERSLEIKKVVHKYNVHRSNLFTIKEELMMSLDFIFNYPNRTEFDIRRTEKAFLYYLLGKLNNSFDDIIKAEQVLVPILKRTHCLFDIDSLKATIRSVTKPSELPDK
jgi:hypothetical protein